MISGTNCNAAGNNRWFSGEHLFLTVERKAGIAQESNMSLRTDLSVGMWCLRSFWSPVRSQGFFKETDSWMLFYGSLLIPLLPPDPSWFLDYFPQLAFLLLAPCFPWGHVWRSRREIRLNATNQLGSAPSSLSPIAGKRCTLCRLPTHSPVRRAPVCQLSGSGVQKTWLWE